MASADPIARRAARPGWWRTLGLIGGLGLGVWGGEAQVPEATPQAWETCRREVRRLAARRGSLLARADSLAAARRRAAGAGDRAAEGRWLAAGEALADSLRAVGAAALAQELVCARLAEALERALAGALAGAVEGAARQPPRPARETDSLLALQARLEGEAGSGLRAEFAPPELGATDPPEVARAQAAFTRDLIDRLDRWLALSARTRERWRHQRLLEEEAAFRDDQRFFDDPAALLQEEGAAGLGDDLEGAPLAGFARLLERMPGPGGAGEDPAAILDLLDAWLGERRALLAQWAAELEAEADRRENEP